MAPRAARSAGRPPLAAAALAALLLPALLAPLALLAPQATAAAGLEAPSLVEPRGPIRIDSDAEFDAAHGVRAGNGTLENPYVISHWRIEGPSVLVRVANTTKPFIVRNLELNGTCVITQEEECLFEAGIHVTNVSDATVVHNRIRDMDRAGISVDRAERVEIVENHITGGGAVNQGAGIILRAVFGSAVVGNLVQDVGPKDGAVVVSAAIRIWESLHTFVGANRIHGATEFGLNLLSTSNVVVVDNDISRNRIGIAAQGRDGVVAFNNISANRFYGVLVSPGRHWLGLERNLMTGNGGGIEVHGDSNVTLRENNIADNRDFGFRLVNNATADARGNWWGHETGPDYDDSGEGDKILLHNTTIFRLLYDPWLRSAVDEAGAFGSRAPRSVVGAAPERAPPKPGEDVDPSPLAAFEGPGFAFIHEPVTFSASRSFDPDGGALQYRWDLGDGNTTAGLRVSHRYPAEGNYTVKLTVVDPQGLESSAGIEVRVVRAPLGVALQVNTTARRGETLEVLASPLGQPLGPVRFRFSTSGPAGFAGEPGPDGTTTIRFDEPGDYFVGVEATGGGETAVAFERVLVENRPPAASIEVAPTEGDTATAFRFRARASDPDGDALTYRWDLAGEPASGQEVTHTFPAAGRQVVQLTVSDGFNSTSTELVFHVRQAGEAPPQPSNPTPGFAPLLAAVALGLAARGARGPGRPGR